MLPESAGASLRERLGAVARDQNGVARRSQLAALGVSKHVVENMLDSRRWTAYGPLALALHNGPLTQRQRMWVTVMNVSDAVGLAARTAAAEYGLAGWEADCIEIVVPRGAKVPRVRGIDVKVHESRRFTAGDIHPGRQLPVVTVERALVDAAVWSASPRTACGILAAGVQQRLTAPGRLLDELSLAGKVRHRKVLAAALADIEGGAHAVSELDFLRFCRRHGLPRPVLQQVRTDPAGRRRYLDATFRRCDGELLRVEIDGALHLVVRTYWDDMSRGNELVLGGERVLRLPSFVVYANDPTALSQIRRALRLSEAKPPLTG